MSDFLMQLRHEVCVETVKSVVELMDFDVMQVCQRHSHPQVWPSQRCQGLSGSKTFIHSLLYQHLGSAQTSF